MVTFPAGVIQPIGIASIDEVDEFVLRCDSCKGSKKLARVASISAFVEPRRGVNADPHEASGSSSMRCSSWYSKSVLTAHTSWFAPFMFSIARIEVSIE